MLIYRIITVHACVAWVLLVGLKPLFVSSLLLIILCDMGMGKSIGIQGYELKIASWVCF